MEVSPLYRSSIVVNALEGSRKQARKCNEFVSGLLVLDFFLLQGTYHDIYVAKSL